MKIKSLFGRSASEILSRPNTSVRLLWLPDLPDALRCGHRHGLQHVAQTLHRLGLVRVRARRKS